MLSKEQSYLIFWYFAIYVCFYYFLDSFRRKGFLSNVLLAFFKGKESFGYVGVVVNYTQGKGYILF